MNRVFRVSGITKVLCGLAILLALFMVWAFIDTVKADNGLSGVILMGVIMVLFLAMALIAVIELNDKVILTDDGIKVHLHRQTFSRSYSLKAIDDEVLWKDIRDASFVEKDNTNLLVLELISGEVREFGIGHMEKRLPVEIESYLNPGTYADEEEEEDADTPQSLEWFKKKTFRKVLAWVSVETVGTVLVALGKRWGLLLALAALLLGCLSLYTYYRYNALLSNPALAKKGRAALFLGALLVVGLFVVAFIIADTTATL